MLCSTPDISLHFLKCTRYENCETITQNCNLIFSTCFYNNSIKSVMQQQCRRRRRNCHNNSQTSAKKENLRVLRKWKEKY